MTLRLGFLWALLALFPAGLPASERTPAPSAESLARAREHVRCASAFQEKGQYPEALAEYRKALDLAPADPSACYGTGTLLLVMWRYDEAEGLFQRALKAKSGMPDAHVWLARIAMRRYDYVKCFSHLKTALQLDAASANAHAMLAFMLMRVHEYEWASKALARAREIDEQNRIAVLGEAYMLRLRKRYDAAAQMLFELLRKNPLNGSAYLELGMTLSSMGRERDGLRVLNRGIKVNPYLPGLRSSRAFVLFKLKDISGSVRAYRKALDIDYDYTGGHGIYSYQIAVRNHPRGAVQANRLAREAEDCLDNGDFKGAETSFLSAIRDCPTHLRSWLGLGTVRFARRDAAGVIEAARGALRAHPDAPLAHNLYIAGRNLLHEQRKAEVATQDYYRIFKNLPRPRIEGIEKVFTNFQSLEPDSQKVILLSVYPLRRFLPELVRKKVTHVVLPLHHHLTDLAAMKPWRGEKTFDGRHYDAVRGVAGRGGLKVAVTGQENLWTSTRMCFNTLAHEFAHQIHGYALRGEDKSTISRLYKKAKKRNRFLDYYSKSDEWEYFAQGYEAFISRTKRPSVSESANNSREDLRLKDPDLYAFLLRITRR